MSKRRYLLKMPHKTIWHEVSDLPFPMAPAWARLEHPDVYEYRPLKDQTVLEIGTDYVFPEISHVKLIFWPLPEYQQWQDDGGQ